jgi:hypothetical protein
LTHHVPDEVPNGESTYTFITNGVERAVELAKVAAGDRYVWPCSGLTDIPDL